MCTLPCVCRLLQLLLWYGESVGERERETSTRDSRARGSRQLFFAAVSSRQRHRESEGQATAQSDSAPNWLSHFEVGFTLNPRRLSSIGDSLCVCYRQGERERSKSRGKGTHTHSIEHTRAKPAAAATLQLSPARQMGSNVLFFFPFFSLFTLALYESTHGSNECSLDASSSPYQLVAFHKVNTQHPASSDTQTQKERHTHAE